MQGIIDIPRLRVSQKIKTPEAFNAKGVSAFHYEDKEHKKLPHIMKFSGGKTSGMLLFVLLDAGLLKAERGDVVVFNNTSAEHPKTYDFVSQCKKVVEEKYKIPFFWVEYQTYEDARRGNYTRLPSFKLVNQNPMSEENPNGYHWRGEVFEEMLSQEGYVPTYFQRTCTQNLKLKTTRMFLGEWLANKSATERMGHFGKSSRMEDDDLYERHQKHGGSVPREIFLEKKAFIRERPFVREEQVWKDYSSVAVPFKNKHIEGKTLGNNADFAKGGVEYVSFVGLRCDEMKRVLKVRERNNGGPESIGYEGENVYMPLATMGVAEEHVLDFWEKQDWGLELNKEDHLSNCTFCFLKGGQKLTHIRDILDNSKSNSLAGTPSDIKWWIQIEEKYGRDLVGEKRDIRSRNIPDNFIGFFGANGKLTYKKLAELSGDDETSDAFGCADVPCDCTD